MRTTFLLLLVATTCVAAACAVGTSVDDGGTPNPDASTGSDGKPTGDALFIPDAKLEGGPNCTAPLVYCANADGGCVDTTSTTEHCGSCSTACATGDAGALVVGSNDNPDAGIPNNGGDAGEPWSLGTPSCATSVCGITCPSTMTLCADDICYDTQQFHEHCGNCNTPCTANQYCAAGHCCASGTAYCGSACIDVLGDKNNCGSCGHTCGANTLCSSGVCVACGTTNEALTATATTSGGGSTSPYLPAEANDGVLETTTCTGFAWITAGNTPGTAWIQYTWPSAHTFTKMHMDTTSATVADSCGNVGRTLGAATVQWWNGSAWVTDGSVSGQQNDWDYTFTAPVTTSKVRLYAIYCTNTSNQTSNPVAFEWQVFGCN